MSPALRYGLALVGSCGLTLLATPVAARLARRWNILDRPKENRFHKRATPYLGGVAVAAGAVVLGLLTGGVSGQLLAIVLGALAVSIIGLVDDLRALHPPAKLAVETGAALALWVAGIRAELFHLYGADLVVTVVWVVAVTNLMNLVDNMDGLASGLTAVSALTYFAIAAGRGDFLVASFALAVAGAALGFLRYNFPPARIFLGDTGSLLLGFLLAAIGLKLDLVGTNGVFRAIVPVLIVGVPAFDTSVLVVSRALARRPIYLGGTDHTSHRLARRGVDPANVALIACGTQAALGLMAWWLVSTAYVVPIALAIGALWLGGAARVLATDFSMARQRARGAQVAEESSAQAA